MSVITIPIAGKNYPFGCADGQEARLIALGKELDARAKAISAQMGSMSESSLLATLCIVLIDELKSVAPNNEEQLLQILSKIEKIKKSIES